MTDQEFFDKIKPYVLDDMRTTGVPACITASQAYIESKHGESGLTVNANNLFGIKGVGTAGTVRMLTTEYYNGVPQKVYANFRKYNNWSESIGDHSAMFLRMKRYQGVLHETNYAKACEFMGKSGYATAPTYGQTLKSCVERFKLYEWDAEVLGTEAKIEPDSKYPTLEKGMKDKDLDKNYIECWQRFLNINGYACGNEDGIFGVNTFYAVRSFQLSKHLIVTGKIDNETWKACLGGKY